MKMAQDALVQVSDMLLMMENLKEVSLRYFAAMKITYFDMWSWKPSHVAY